MGESLLRPSDGHQLDLPIPEEFLRAAESRGEFTGERLFEQKPEVYSGIVRLLAEGMGVIRIGRTLKVSPNTVLAVRDREGEAIDIEKKNLSTLYRRGARLAGERILEDLTDDERAAKIPANQKAVIVGILTEKSELLGGGVTSRVAHAQEPSNEDFEKYLSSLPDAEVCVMENQAETGEQKALGHAPPAAVPAAGGAAGEGLEMELKKGSRDQESGT